MKIPIELLMMIGFFCPFVLKWAYEKGYKNGQNSVRVDRFGRKTTLPEYRNPPPPPERPNTTTSIKM